MGGVPLCNYEHESDREEGEGEDLVSTSTISYDPNEKVHIVQISDGRHKDEFGRVSNYFAPSYFNHQEGKWEITLASEVKILCRDNQLIHVVRSQDLWSYHEGQIWSVDNLYTTECKEIKSKIKDDWKPIKNHGFTMCFTQNLHDEKLAQKLYKKVILLGDVLPKKFIQTDSNVIYEMFRVDPMMSIMKFSSPTHYLPTSLAQGDRVCDKDNGLQSVFTFLIFLKDDVDGGGIQFPYAEHDIEPKKGTCIFLDQNNKLYCHAIAKHRSGTGLFLKGTISYQRVRLKRASILPPIPASEDP